MRCSPRSSRCGRMVEDIVMADFPRIFLFVSLQSFTVIRWTTSMTHHYLRRRMLEAISENMETLSTRTLGVHGSAWLACQRARSGSFTEFIIPRRPSLVSCHRTLLISPSLGYLIYSQSLDNLQTDDTLMRNARKRSRQTRLNR